MPPKRKRHESLDSNGAWTISKWVSAAGALVALIIGTITLWNLAIHPAAAQFVDNRIANSERKMIDQLGTLKNDISKLKDLTLENRINANDLQKRSLDRERFDLLIQLDIPNVPNATKLTIQNRIRQLEADSEALARENDWLRKSKENLQ